MIKLAQKRLLPAVGSWTVQPLGPDLIAVLELAGIGYQRVFRRDKLPPSLATLGEMLREAMDLLGARPLSPAATIWQAADAAELYGVNLYCANGQLGARDDAVEYIELVFIDGQRPVVSRRIWGQLAGCMFRFAPAQEHRH